MRATQAGRGWGRARGRDPVVLDLVKLTLSGTHVNRGLNGLPHRHGQSPPGRSGETLFCCHSMDDQAGEAFSQGQVLWLKGSEGSRRGHPPPLLLFQLMVSDLLALQVQLGVLKLSCEPLALLLELLQSPLTLIAICLQVSKLEVEEACTVSSPATAERPGRRERPEHL